MNPSSEYRTKDLGHLGLVAGMCKEIGIQRIIGEAIPIGGRVLSHGEAVVGMILNGLGFVNQRIYLTQKFFENKPLEQFFDMRLEATDFHEVTLGRTLDALYAYGLETLYLKCALQARKVLGLRSKVGHLDSSSFSTYGKYALSEEGEETGVIRITQGYSKDHRSDLNQFVINLLVESEASLPLWMSPASGNQSDRVAFGEIITQHIQSLKEGAEMEAVVCDSALYSEENLKKIAPLIRFITRVPATLELVERLYAEFDPKALTPLDEDYAYTSLGSLYGGIRQRWILVRSRPNYQAALPTLNRQDLKASAQEEKAFQRLCRQRFHCQEDAQIALEQFQKGLKILEIHSPHLETLNLYAKRGKPSREAVPQRVEFQIRGSVASSLAMRRCREALKGWFVLATNHLDESLLSDAQVLLEYKQQSRVERGFRFLKSPEFLAPSIFLKKPQRIMALSMVMTLCLLVYAALEYRIRKGLASQQKTVPDQKGKPTQNPTARWVFHLFVGVHVLYQGTQRISVLNLREEHSIITQVLGYQFYYR